MQTELEILNVLKEMRLMLSIDLIVINCVLVAIWWHVTKLQ